jgi:hypothetical protein
VHRAWVLEPLTPGADGVKTRTKPVAIVIITLRGTPMAAKELSSWDILREPNRILLQDDYRSGMELLIYLLTWGVEIGLLFVFALTFLRR